MTNWIRTRMLPLIAVLVALSLVAGCGAAKETDTGTTPPASAASNTADTPKVDKAAVITDAAKQYFNTIPASNHQIDSKDLKAKIDAKDATIYPVDIRKAEDFAKEHVDGFVNIPFLTIGQNMDKLPKDKQIVVSCYTGQTAGQTIAALRMAGYNAISVKFGWKGITDSGVYTIIKQ